MMQGFSPVKSMLWGQVVRVDVLILDQEKNWVSELKGLCRKDGINFCEKKEDAEDIRLVVTDFPLGRLNGGRLAGIPFLLVSRERREEKILEAFAAGAEDYMVFPVSPRVARVRILRILKQEGAGGSRPDLGELQEGVHFTPNEYKILSFMMQQPGKVFSRNELLEGAFPGWYEGYDRNVDNYMKQIRRKLGQGGRRIETVYGVGYRYMP